MSGCKHPLTNLALLLLLFLLYFVYPIPFITAPNARNFQLSKDFLIIETCGGVTVMLTTLIGNSFCLAVFLGRQHTDVGNSVPATENRAKFAYILMFIADAIQPFTALPARLNANWNYYYENLPASKHDLPVNNLMSSPFTTKNTSIFHDDDPLTFHGSRMGLLIMHSVWYWFVVVSLLFFTVACVLDFYVSVRHIEKHLVSMELKCVVLFMVGTIATLPTYLYYYIQMNSTWNKGEGLAVLSYFIPVTVCTLCLLLTHIFQVCFKTIPLAEENMGESAKNEKRHPSTRFVWMMWLSYVVCYTPFYLNTWKGQAFGAATIHATHGMALLKPCCNVFVMIEFDAVSKQQLIQKLLDAWNCFTGCFRNLCLCCSPCVVGLLMWARDKVRAMLDNNKADDVVVMETEGGGMIVHYTISPRQNGANGLLLTKKSIMMSTV